MPFSLSAASLSKLTDVDPRLVRVVKRAIELTEVDFKVVEGLRSDEQAYVNFGKGRSAQECALAGCPAKYAQPKLAKVTWLRNPLSSKHRRQADGFGKAVDLLPAPYDWKDLAPFTKVAEAMAKAAKELKVPVRWGANWDGDEKFREKGETDNPHFELG